MFNRTLIYEHDKSKKLIISLCGRNVSVGNMFKFTLQCSDDSSICTIEPYDFEWYPVPNGPYDQYHSVKILNKNIGNIKNRIEKIQNLLEISSNNTFVLGYSAGGVVAAKLLEITTTNYAGFIIIGGCSLEPHKITPAMTKTPVLVIHNKKDDCFDWYERYLPTKESLIKNNYNLSFIERPYSNHALSNDDIWDSKDFIKKFS